MTKQEIYDILRLGGLTHAGALGLIGNMMAESTPALKPTIAERGRTSISDEEYTRLADAGAGNFVHDAVGYGLCQWTYWSRKRQLLDYARSMGVSVGDGIMQVHFALAELKTNPEFAGVCKILNSSDNIDECADIVCRDFERPHDLNYAARRAYARQAEKEIVEDASAPAVPATPAGETDGSAQPEVDLALMVLQACMQRDGFWPGAIDGIKSPEFCAALKKYAAAVASC